MTSVLLVYPFFRRSLDRSRFRFPPLGIAYVASALRAAGHDVRLVDCTFLRREEALARALAEPAEVTGIYAMSTMEDDCDWMAARLRAHSPLLVAGGPLPTCEPAEVSAAVRRRGARRGGVDHGRAPRRARSRR